MKTTMGILAGKASHFILSKLGRGSTLPGKIALKFDKDILDTLAKDYEIVVVTGTNGKTLTTALTVGILKEAFGEIVTNPSGANMITGITSTFLTAKKAKSGKKIAVLEIDEASLPKITEYITPSLFVFTNIFRDQMDRYGEIYTTYQMILDGAAKHLRPLFWPMGTVLSLILKKWSILYASMVLTLKNTLQSWHIIIPKELSALNVRAFFSIASILMLIWVTMYASTVTFTVQN